MFPVNDHSRSQQRSSPCLRLRLTALFVSIERVWWIAHSLITFCGLDTWQITFHTPVVEEVAGPRDICRGVLTAILSGGVLQQLFECLPQPLPDVTYWTKTSIQSVWVPKTMPWMKHNSSHVVTPLVYSCSSTCSSKLYLYFSWEAYFAFVGDPSYSLVLDWRRSRSTHRSIHMNEPK